MTDYVILDKSTLSSSTKPIFPTPALVKNSDAGQPNPPAPIINIFDLINFFCPKTPIFFKIICLENLLIGLVI